MEAGVGQESDDEDEDSEDEGVCSDDENINEMISILAETNRPATENTKRVQTISESSDISMKDAEGDEGKT